MIKKTVTYEDFNGISHTEDLYFNLTKTEVLQIAKSDPQLIDDLQAAIATKDGLKLMDSYEKFIKKSYGIKSEDGRRFIKSEEALNDFLQSAVYDKFFWDLMNDPEGAGDFILGIMPKDMTEQALQKIKDGEITVSQ